MTDSMIERVARHICITAQIDPNKHMPDTASDFGHGRHSAWMAFRDQARAILAVLREPTEAMERAGYGNSVGDPDYTRIVENPDPIAAYQAMIDTALKDER